MGSKVILATMTVHDPISATLWSRLIAGKIQWIGEADFIFSQSLISHGESLRGWTELVQSDQFWSLCVAINCWLMKFWSTKSCLQPMQHVEPYPGFLICLSPMPWLGTSSAVSDWQGQVHTRWCPCPRSPTFVPVGQTGNAPEILNSLGRECQREVKQDRGMRRGEKRGGLRQTVLQAEEEKVKGSQVGQSPPLKEEEEGEGTWEQRLGSEWEDNTKEKAGSQGQKARWVKVRHWGFLLSVMCSLWGGVCVCMKGGECPLISICGGLFWELCGLPWVCNWGAWKQGVQLRSFSESTGTFHCMKK